MSSSPDPRNLDPEEIERGVKEMTEKMKETLDALKHTVFPEAPFGVLAGVDDPTQETVERIDDDDDLPDDDEIDAEEGDEGEEWKGDGDRNG